MVLDLLPYNNPDVGGFADHRVATGADGIGKVP
jgi:hypothetical protein